MDEPPRASDSTDDAGLAPESTRRRRRRAMGLIILAKVGMVAVFLALPSGVAISLGAAHGVALLVLLVAAAVALVAYRRWGGTPWPDRLPHAHGAVPAWARQTVASILKHRSHE